ncbi:MAG: hypothetical protein R6W48_11380 [Gaiellaceae bacterium]
MSTYPTPPALSTTWSPDEARASWTRSVAVALLACVPLPLLSLGGMLLPIPELVQRAAATFAPLAPFLEDEGDRVVRQRAAARPLEIKIAAGGGPTALVLRTSGADGALERAAVAPKPGVGRTPQRHAAKADAAAVRSPARPAPKAPPASPPRSDDRAPAQPDAPVAPAPPGGPTSEGGSGGAAAKPAPTAPTQGSGGQGGSKAGSGKSGSSSGSGSQSGSTDGGTADPGKSTGGGNGNGNSGGQGGSGGSGGQGSGGSPSEHSSGQGRPEASPGSGAAKGPGKP